MSSTSGSRSRSKTLGGERSAKRATIAVVKPERVPQEALGDAKRLVQLDVAADGHFARQFDVGRGDATFRAMLAFCMSLRTRNVDEKQRATRDALRQFVERQVHTLLPNAALAARGLTLATGLAEQYDVAVVLDTTTLSHLAQVYSSVEPSTPSASVDTAVAWADAKSAAASIAGVTAAAAAAATAVAVATTSATSATTSASSATATATATAAAAGSAAARNPSLAKTGGPSALELLAQLDGQHRGNLQLARECAELERRTNSRRRAATMSAESGEQAAPAGGGAPTLTTRNELERRRSDGTAWRAATASPLVPRSTSTAPSHSSPRAAASSATTAGVLTSSPTSTPALSSSSSSAAAAAAAAVASPKTAERARPTLERTDSRSRLPLLAEGALRVAFDVKLAPDAETGDAATLKMMAVLRVECVKGGVDVSDVRLVETAPTAGVSRRRPQDELLALPLLAAGHNGVLRLFFGVVRSQCVGIVNNAVSVAATLSYVVGGSAAPVLVKLALPLPTIVGSKLVPRVASSSPSVPHRAALPSAAPRSPSSSLHAAATSSSAAANDQLSPRLTLPQRELGAPRAASPPPRSVSPRGLSPRGLSPRAASPRAASPRAASHRPTRDTSPRRGRGLSPRARSPTAPPAAGGNVRALSPGARGGVLVADDAAEQSRERGRSPRARSRSRSRSPRGASPPAASAGSGVRGVSPPPSSATAGSGARARSPTASAASPPPARRVSPTRARSPLRALSPMRLFRALSPRRKTTTGAEIATTAAAAVAAAAAAAASDTSSSPVVPGRAAAGARAPRPTQRGAAATKHTGYGVPLSELGLHPNVFDVPVRWLEEHAQMTEGLFRQSPSSELVEALCAQLSSGVDLKLDASTDAHTVAGMLQVRCVAAAAAADDGALRPRAAQRFLRELPEPLLSFALFDEFLAAREAPAATLRALTLRVPSSHRYVLVRLIRLLGAVADNVAQTRMDARNLGTVFGPTMLAHTDPMRSLTGLKDGNVVVARLIDERAIVFGEHAARHPANRYTGVFNTLEATHVARILDAQRALDKDVTSAQQSAGVAANDKLKSASSAASTSSPALLAPPANASSVSTAPASTTTTSAATSVEWNIV